MPLFSDMIWWNRINFHLIKFVSEIWFFLHKIWFPFNYLFAYFPKVCWCICIFYITVNGTVWFMLPNCMVRVPCIGYAHSCTKWEQEPGHVEKSKIRNALETFMYFAYKYTDILSWNNRYVRIWMEIDVSCKFLHV